MPILNYTTKVPAAKSISQIVQLLVRKGCRSVTQEFGAGAKVTAVRFVMLVGRSNVQFLLPSDVEGVFNHMKQHAPPRFRSREQAERVSWRIIKDWVEAQLALHESGQADLSQLFMPYALIDAERTVYQEFLHHQQIGTGTPAMRLGQGR